MVNEESGRVAGKEMHGDRGVDVHSPSLDIGGFLPTVVNHNKNSSPHA